MQSRLQMCALFRSIHSINCFVAIRFGLFVKTFLNWLRRPLKTKTKSQNNNNKRQCVLCFPLIYHQLLCKIHVASWSVSLSSLPVYWYDSYCAYTLSIASFHLVDVLRLAHFVHYVKIIYNHYKQNALLFIGTLVILCHNCGRNWMELGEKIGRDGNFAPFNVLSSLSVCLRLNVCSTVKIHTIARFSMRLLAEFSNGYSLIVIFRPGHQIFYVSFTLPMVNDNFILLHFFTTTCILPMKRGEKLCTSWYL